ncbi:hypothetical protein [Paenibacillus wenxiniae]|uniref:WG containing repeat-containing protein n=1 Tax=Paenibacillus wenxiniae TaxID=1636843 RepID=A0ABW4RNP0_9BACL
MSNVTIKLLPFADLSSYMDGFTLVSAQWGHDGLAYVLLINEVPERKQGMFVKTKLEQSYTYKVLVVAEQYIEELVIPDQRYLYHYVQPLHEQLLLVGARATYYGQDQFDRNARVWSRDGVPMRDFLLGDGIESVQVTRAGTIWTSYFDEGVYGNYGWVEPIGASGLIAWDAEGNIRYKNTAALIDDCYALNVVNEQDVWFYYYSDFQLGHITNGVQTESSQVTFLHPGISGSSGFITDGEHFLFDAGYNKHGLFRFKTMHKPGHLNKGRVIEFVNEHKQPLQHARQDLRQDRLLFCTEQALYGVTLNEIQSALV